ncbi:MAG: Zn-ribbon domain-containing OB-fold protein [Burkholderiaceae bacterium]|nr:Zn-ribbon domain-containing OB-fold protein [Burkholderiaceae bacterium]
MTGARPFPPRVSAFTRPFWEALAQGRLITTRCTACGTLSFPPRNLCRECWSRNLEWVPLAPHGRLYSFTRVHVVPGAFSADAPYAIGIVDLADGVRVMCRMMGEVSAAHLDGPAQMALLRYDDGPLFGATVGP